MDEMLIILRKAAEQGHAQAQFSMGLFIIRTEV
jgi:TPR repeat protein